MYMYDLYIHCRKKIVLSYTWHKPCFSDLFPYNKCLYKQSIFYIIVYQSALLYLFVIYAWYKSYKLNVVHIPEYNLMFKTLYLAHAS